VPLIAGEQLFRLGDRYLLGLYHGAEIGAEYTVCMSIALIAYTVGNNVLMIMVPVFNRTKAERGRAGAADDHSDPALRVLFSRMLRYAWIFAFVTVSAFLFCPDAFVRLLAAPKYADAAYLLRWASPTAFFFISFAVFSRVLIAEDRHWLVGGLTLAGAGLNILLNVVLIPTLAGVGAALATSISLAAMCLAAGVVLKAWTWIEPGELHLVKLGALLIVSALLFAGLHRTGWVALIQVALGGTGCLALMFGLRLFRPGELAGLTGGRATP